MSSPEHDEEDEFRRALRTADRETVQANLRIFSGVGAFTGMLVGALVGDEKDMVTGAAIGAAAMAVLKSAYDRRR
jgi:hypothetical protein